MSRLDQWVNLLLIGIIILYLSILAVGYFIHRSGYLISILNIVTAGSILLYWIIRQMQISQHYFELREMIVLLFEVIVIACALYSIFSGQRLNSIKIMQYVFYGIHLTVLVLGVLFLLTFKINRLI